MRVRILKALTGIIEGHSLRAFIPGYIYDVDYSTGEQLIELNAVVEVRSTDPAVTDEDVDVACLTGGVHMVPQETAEDRPERRRRKRR